MTYVHLRADCLYTGISSGPNARYPVWEKAFTFTFLVGATQYTEPSGRTFGQCPSRDIIVAMTPLREANVRLHTTVSTEAMQWHPEVFSPSVQVWYSFNYTQNAHVVTVRLPRLLAEHKTAVDTIRLVD